MTAMRHFKKESEFQRYVKSAIQKRFPDSVVIKVDQFQGIPDLLILYKDKWALLEVKINKNAKKQPNQEYFIDKFNEWSYASFIYPENMEEVFNELHKAFGS